MAAFNSKRASPLFRLKAFALIACLCGVFNQLPLLAASDYFSPSSILVSADGNRLFVTETTAGIVAELDPRKGSMTRRYKTKDAPTGIALSPSGDRLYVTAGISRGRVIVFSVESGQKLESYEAGHSPTAPVLSKDGKTLYVCNRFVNRVSAIDTASGSIRSQIPVEREPVSAALTRDGKRLLVANHLPAGAADQDYVAATISVIETSSHHANGTLELPNGSNGLRDICLSPDGAFAYIGHTLARYQVPATQLERGWVNTNAVSVFNLDTMKRVDTFLLDDIDLGAPNPWGIAVTENGATLAVTHAGSHEVSLIDRLALHEKLSGDSANDLRFISSIRRRVPLLGKGPRSCAISGTSLYVAQYFSDDVGVVELSDPRDPIVSSLSLGPVKEMDETRRGRFLFNDGSFCFQQWQSCVSCHPSERVDALNWDLLNDGIGSPRNTKSLLYSHETPPTTITGCRANAETSVRAGIRFFMAVLPESDAAAIDAFLKSMQPVPSPRLSEGKFTDSALLGKALFEESKCSMCHSGKYFTDKKLYDVGTGKGRDAGAKFDVPTLIEVWRTAPYLHDGRARSIRDVIKAENPDDDHGHTQGLLDNEVDDLVEYVLSL